MQAIVASDSQPPQWGRCQEMSELPPRMTVFCDLDGPIADVSDRYYMTYEIALLETQTLYQQQGMGLELQPLSKQQFWQMKQDRVPDSQIAQHSGLCGEQVNLFLQRVLKMVNQPALLHRDRLQPGVQWALALLHSRNVQLVLVTLRPQGQAVQLLQNYGLARLFTSIRGSQVTDAAYYNYAELKTRLLAEVAGELDLQTEAAWMIGDTEADILAGQALEIPTIALTCGIRSIAQLEKFQPTCILSDLISATHYLLNCARVAGANY